MLKDIKYKEILQLIISKILHTFKDSCNKSPVINRIIKGKLSNEEAAELSLEDALERGISGKKKKGFVMPRFLNDLRILIMANLWIIPVFGGLIGSVFYFVTPPPPMYATMVTGSESGTYYDFALKLQHGLKQHGFELTVIPSGGSMSNLHQLLVDPPIAQIAVVQSGIEQELNEEDKNRISSLGALFQEPVWLFYNKNIYLGKNFVKEIKLAKLADLRNLRVNIGFVGSPTHSIVTRLLAINGIYATDYPESWQATGTIKAIEALKNGALDALFITGTAESKYVKMLANNHDLEIFNFRRTKAYESHLPFLHGIDIAEGLIDMATNRPSANISTMSSMATLIANDSLNPGLVPLFLQVSQEVLAEGTLLDKAGEFPKADNRSYEMHADATRFYKNGLPMLQRFLPFRIASLADRYIVLLIPLIMIMIPLMKAIGPVYQWRIKSRIYRWYKYIREVEKELAENKDYTREEILQHADNLIKMEVNLRQVDVPLSYSKELYHLHLHIRYVIDRLKELASNK